MVTGMFQMVDSFRYTIEEWFDIRFQAELYISERGVTGAGTINGIDPTIMDELVQDETIAYADVVYISYAKPKEGITILSGVDMKAWTTSIKQLWYKPPGSFISEVGAEPALISETFARRFDLINGGVTELDTPSGRKKISPVGIFSDYGNEFGTAAVDIKTWKAWTQSERPINVSLYLNEGTDVNQVRDRLRLSFPGLDVRNGKELRDVALGIFEQTFKATSALNIIGLVVAFAGLLLGLFSIFDESSSYLAHSASPWLFQSSVFAFCRIRRCGNRVGCLDKWFPDRIGSWLVVGQSDQCTVVWMDSPLACPLHRFSHLWDPVGSDWFSLGLPGICLLEF